MANKKSRERELAAQLFISTSITQKEISERLQVSEKTVSGWAIDDNWDDLKTAHLSTNSQMVSDIKIILKNLVEKKKLKMDEDTFSKNDADAILELAKAIDTLEGQIPLRTSVQVLEEFMDFIPYEDIRLKTELAKYQTKYLLHKSKR